MAGGDPGGGANVTSEASDLVTESLVLAQLVCSSTNLILIFVYWTYLLYASISRYTILTVDLSVITDSYSYVIFLQPM